MLNTPDLSIVLPVHNAESTVKDTLDSLASQTYDNLEIIIVNDGSTDGSLSILESYATADKRFSLITTCNNGAYIAREIGISKARGKYIGFCDSDDTMDCRMYEILMREAQKTDADIAICAYKRVSPYQNTRIEMAQYGQIAYSCSNDKGWLAAINTSLWNKIIKRSLLEGRKAISNPPRIMEDAYLLYSIFEKVETVCFTPIPLYNYIIRDNSAISHLEPDEPEQLICTWKNLRKLYPNQRELIDLGAFIHLGISLSALILKSSTLPNAINTVKTINEKIASEFSTIINNKYLRMSYISTHRALLTTKAAHMLYRMHLLPIALTTYCHLERKGVLQIRW